MKNSLSREGMSAFQERFSDAQNQSVVPSHGVFITTEIEADIRNEQLTSFKKTEFPEDFQQQPTRAVLLLAITELALHICRSKQPLYRVRFDSRGADSLMDRHYAPRIDWEFHLGALDQWCSKKFQQPKVLSRENILHPAAKELIEIAQKVYDHNLKPRYPTFEEYHALSEEQLQRNLIAEKMRQWYSLPSSKALVKNWAFKGAVAKADFILDWDNEIKSNDCFIFRTDLLFEEIIFGSWGDSYSILDKNIKFLEELIWGESRLGLIRSYIDPYIDMDGNWNIPVVLLIRSVSISIQEIENCILKLWNSAIFPHKGRQVSNFICDYCDYRFITREHLMLDSQSIQLLRAAIYIFDTKFIADTSLGSIILRNEE